MAHSVGKDSALKRTNILHHFASKKGNFSEYRCRVQGWIKYLICRSDKGTHAEWILGSVARNKNPANPIRNCRKHIFRLDEKPGRERSITSCDPIPGIFPASFLRKQFQAQPTKNGNRAQETGSSEWEREKHFGKNINLFSCLWKELIPDSISHA